MSSTNVPNILGEAPAFLAMLEHVSTAAPLDKPVLIIGERGTGKELVSQRLHFLSHRWDQPLVKLNCAALTETLLESELFGHEAGAFTGATRRHEGRFERADGGTLLLDELGTIPLRMQEKILRVIEYGEFERVGGADTLSVDVRVIGSTNEDLPRLARRGRFRHDLLDRLAFDVVTVPPLRACPAAILCLGEHLGARAAREFGRPLFPGFSPGAAHGARHTADMFATYKDGLRQFCEVHDARSVQAPAPGSACRRAEGRVLHRDRGAAGGGARRAGVTHDAGVVEEDAGCRPQH